MNLQEQIQYYERIVVQKQQEHDALWGKNPTSPTEPIAYINDVLPYKHLLRMVYLKADRPVCWGAIDCLDQAYQKCTSGKHETCAKHTHECLGCKAENK